ncbi:MAG TPA: rhodanese-like domain-containing protein [Phycisphaerales bacterium]
MPLILVQRTLAIVGLGCVLGAADSWLRPTVITLKDNASAPRSEPAPTTPSRSAAARGMPAQTTTPEPAPALSDKATKTPDATSAASLGLMIDAKAAKALFDQGVVFLDARIQPEFDAGHVPQAFLLNSTMFGTPAADDAMKVLDANAPVVIYCGGGDCDASKNVAILLQQAGFKQIHIIEKGFPEWKELGYPIETAADRTNAGGKP